MNNNKQEQEDPLKVVLVKVALAAFQGSKDMDKQEDQEGLIIHSVIYLRSSRSSLEEGEALGEQEEEVQEQVNKHKEKAKT